jgi:hypothetical protein
MVQISLLPQASAQELKELEPLRSQMIAMGQSHNQ